MEVVILQIFTLICRFDAGYNEEYILQSFIKILTPFVKYLDLMSRSKCQDLTYSYNFVVLLVLLIDYSNVVSEILLTSLLQ